MSARPPHPGTLFARAIAELDRCGIYAKPNVNSIYAAIRRAGGHDRPTQLIHLEEGVQLIEKWLAEREQRKPMPETADSWRLRAEWVPDRAMRMAMERARAAIVRGASRV